MPRVGATKVAWNQARPPRELVELAKRGLITIDRRAFERRTGALRLAATAPCLQLAAFSELHERLIDVVDGDLDDVSLPELLHPKRKPAKTR